MKKYLGVILVLTTMILNILVKSYVGIGVNGVLIFLGIIALIKGFKLEEIVENGYLNGKKSLLVIKIFLLVGGISSIWIMSGTIPTVVYQGIRLMNPNYFYLSSFLITSVVAFLLGSAFGTSGTVGIAMIAIGKGLGADLSIVGGTVISGAYFGDRCSPVSSSANLVATLTKTNLYINIKNMLKTGAIPFVLSGILYVLCNSGSNEIVKNIAMLDLLEKNFNLTYLNFLPIYPILKGGGILSMWKTAIIIFISCCLSGLIQMLKTFSKIEEIILKSKSEFSLFIWTVIVSIIAGMLGCNQSIAVVMTIDIMKKI